MLITKNFWKPPVFKNVSFVILILQTCLVLGQQKVVVIDPGHGGKDTGAIGINGLKEKDVVLNVADQVLALNKNLFENEFEIYLTRYKDTLISISDRTRLARTLKVDLFISIYCNASSNNAEGTEIFVYNRRSIHGNHSMALGTSILIEFRVY